MILILSGLVYAVAFLIIGRKHPQIPLMLIFASAPFQNDISGGGALKFSIAEVNLLLSVPLFFMLGRRVRLGPIAFPVALYIGICLLSSLANWRSTTQVSIIQTILYYVVAVAIFAGLPRTERDFQPAFIGLICVCVFLAIAGIAARSPYYLGLHKNGVGASLACATVVCTELIFAERRFKARLWYGAALAVIAGGLIFTLSRGAWLAAIIGILVILALRRQFVLILRGGMVLIPATLIFWQMMPEESREYATDFSSDRYSIKARYVSKEYAEQLFKASPILGIGVGLRKEYDATNVTLLTLAETGVAGLAAFLLIHIVFCRSIWNTQKYVRRSTLRYSVLAIGGALMIGRLAHGQVDLYWSRGVLMNACTAMGMAIHAQLATQKEIKRARRQRALEQAAREENELVSRFA